MKYKNDFLDLRWNIFNCCLTNRLKGYSEYSEQILGLLAISDIIMYDYHSKELSGVLTFSEYCDILTDGMGGVILTLNVSMFNTFPSNFKGIQLKMEEFNKL